MRKIIAVDFDGCICADASPNIGAPDWTVICKIIEEQKRGTAVILWTCREGRILQEAVSACEKWGIKFDAVNTNVPEVIKFWGMDSRKVSADEYWDDRGIKVVAHS